MGKERIKSLDGLRAFAIIFVLFAHSAWKFQSPIILKIGSAEFHGFIYNGWSGVDLFFVLSGFLIASQLLRKPLTTDNLKKFLGKRYFRIAPAYYVSVILTLLTLHILPEINQTPLSELWETWHAPLLAHLTFTHDYIGRQPIIDGLFWSIPVEAKFYMLLPLLIYGLTRIKNNTHRIVAVAGFFLLHILLKTLTLYSEHGQNPISYLDYFLNIKTPFHLALEGLTIGVLCAFLMRHEKIKQINPNTVIPNTLFLTGLILFLILSRSPHFTDSAATFFEYTIMTGLLSLSFGLALIALVKGCCATAFFENIFLKFVAKISYSLYLTHLYALYFQITLIEKLATVINSPTLCWLISLPPFLIAATCLAYVLHTTIEKPFIDWSRQKWSDRT